MLLPSPKKLRVLQQHKHMLVSSPKKLRVCQEALAAALGTHPLMFRTT